MLKQVKILSPLPLVTSFLLLILFLGFQNFSYASNSIINDTIGYNQYRGIVVDSKTKKPLVFASLTLNRTNISTISNTQGEFLLKVPEKYASHRVTISFLGYKSKVLNLSNFNKDKIIIKLKIQIEKLVEVEITVKDANALIREVLKRKRYNYFSDHTTMTAFYRETIKKRRTYVSLSEAIIEINKQPYTSSRGDILKLYKSRKSTDYKRLDTLVLKLRGGPFSSMYLDIMKNPVMFFTEEMTDTYEFSFDSSSKIDDELIYVINFKQKPHITEPLYYGKLYINARSLALTSAKFKLNLKDKYKASKLFIIKKPRRATVFPTEATYQIDYRVKNDKWYYGYSRIQLGFKIDWDKKLFNSHYYSTIEMAVTDWEKNTSGNFTRPKDRLKSSSILTDEASGFSDPEFWGEFNVIEPEKPIESAIKKIQKQLKKIKRT